MTTETTPAADVVELLTANGWTIDTTSPKPPVGLRVQYWNWLCRATPGGDLSATIGPKSALFTRPDGRLADVEIRAPLERIDAELVAAIVALLDPPATPVAVDCDHPWHNNPGLVISCPQCRAGDEIAEFVDDLAKRLAPETLQEFREAERYILARGLKLCGLTAYPEAVGRPDNADGGMICAICGQDYASHPDDWRLIGYGNVPVYNILCDGRRVKL